MRPNLLSQCGWQVTALCITKFLHNESTWHHQVACFALAVQRCWWTLVHLGLVDHVGRLRVLLQLMTAGTYLFSVPLALNTHWSIWL